MDKRDGSFQTEDDRGRLVSMLDPYALHLLRRYDVIAAEPLAEVAAALGSGLTRLARFFLLFGILCSLIGVVAFVGSLVRVVRAGGIVWPLSKWLLLANFWIVPFTMWLSARQVRLRRIRSVMLAHRRCPHCGYDLRLLPADSKDNATVCPECGCAWLLGPMSLPPGQIAC